MQCDEHWKQKLSVLLQIFRKANMDVALIPRLGQYLLNNVLGHIKCLLYEENISKENVYCVLYSHHQKPHPFANAGLWSKGWS